MVELKSVGVLRLGVFGAVAYAIMGVLEALLFAPVMAFAPMSPNGSGFPEAIRPYIAIGAFIGLPILFAIGGFIGGIIAAFVYNLVASWTGGLQLTITPVASDSGSMSIV